MSDPGTGKTLVALTAREERKRRLLVVCPKSIQEAAWAHDIEKFYPKTSYAILTAEDRWRGWEETMGADITIVNTDGVKWLMKHPMKELTKRWRGEMLVIDESSKFKNPNSDRSKALLQLSKIFSVKVCLSGTPTPKTILDIWHQAFLLDGGKRLGWSYYKFRSDVCYPERVGRAPTAVAWRDREGAELAVSGLLRDITVRHKLEDVVELPPRIVRSIDIKLPEAQMKQYKKLETEALLQLEEGEVDAVNAAVLTAKLLQLASGAVYGTRGEILRVDGTRTELAMDLAEECPHSVIFFQWKHQRDQLLEEAKKRKRLVKVIDGETPMKDRGQIVKDFQAGLIDDILAHPASAGHGLTLTAATRSIWVSPTYDLELFDQGSRRIYRIGQNKKTENIILVAKDTIEPHVADVLAGKARRMTNLTELLKWSGRSPTSKRSSTTTKKKRSKRT
jgi:SNF2 family DNA or RNA helicase